jgi:signal transduction histidine kinase/CheY-like chemotaxis protein
VPVEIRTFPVKIQQKALVLGVARGITERKQLEAQLRQAQKMEGIGQLAGGVAHDFNNLLAIMRGNADLLLMDAEQNPPQTNECLKHIAAAAERAATLTRQLLIFSRKQAMQSEPLVLNGLVQNLTKMLNRVIREDIRLECRYAERLPFVQADPGMLEQALLNLVVNARDAMPRGGQLLIATEAVSFDAAYARTHPDARPGEFVCLSVSDTGTGIAPEHLERIFEPFFTTKEPGKGTGLGLATVYGIVKQHRGWVEVFSRIGEGTTFRILLPAIPPPASLAVPPAEAELCGGSETILLVEDDFSVRMITRRMLETFKYKVHEATCAREAVEVWGRHAAEIALLLTDMVMPEGVTGRELAEQLRAAKPGLKVIFMSGYSADVVGEDTKFFRKTGSYFLHKPCATAALIQTVRKCLDENAPGSVHG